MSFYVLRNSTTLMMILLFSSKAFCHLRTKYIHLHLGFPAKYLHTGECRCDQHLVELHTHRDVCFLLSWAPTGEVSHSLSAKASGTYRRNVCVGPLSQHGMQMRLCCCDCSETSPHITPQGFVLSLMEVHRTAVRRNL